MNAEQKGVRAMNIDIALAAATAAGVTGGVILSLGADEKTLISLSGSEAKLSLAAAGDWFGIFSHSAAGAGLILLAAFLLGFCAVAQPFEILLASFRGLGLGVCVRGIYLGEGIFRSMALFLPFATASTGILLLGIKEAFRLSMRYLSISATSENRIGLRREIKDYVFKFIVMAALILAFAALDAFIALLLCRLT